MESVTALHSMGIYFIGFFLFVYSVFLIEGKRFHFIDVFSQIRCTCIIFSQSNGIGP